MSAEIGRILGIAVRGGFRGPMVEKAEARLTENGGIDGDLASRPDRGVTLLASQQWATVQKELGAELAWHSRRANILVDAAGLRSLIGCAVAIGEVRIGVVAETKPCGLMDRI